MFRYAKMWLGVLYASRINANDSGTRIFQDLSFFDKFHRLNVLLALKIRHAWSASSLAVVGRLRCLR